MYMCIVIESYLSRILISNFSFSPSLLCLLSPSLSLLLHLPPLSLPPPSFSPLLPLTLPLLAHSPVTDHKATPASRKRTSTRYKRNNSISLSALYREEEEGKEHTNRSFLISDQDPDFLPSGFSPYKAKKKAKRH